jgi:hypothetical protein
MVPSWPPGREHGVPLSPGARNREWWCGRRDSNPQGPKPNGFSYRLRLSPPECRLLETPPPGLRSGLSLHRLPDQLRSLGAARLVSTPSRRDYSVRLGSGLPFHRVPRIWAVLHRWFPGEHSSCLKSVASTSFATPALPISLHPTLDANGTDAKWNLVHHSSESRFLVPFEFPFGFCFFFGFGRMTLIAAASRLVLMCAA